jgi:hypothetical protein
LIFTTLPCKVDNKQHDGRREDDHHHHVCEWPTYRVKGSINIPMPLIFPTLFVFLPYHLISLFLINWMDCFPMAWSSLNSYWAT